jgi:hypothetical protein
VQGYPGICAKAYDIARVRRDFRFVKYQVKH